MEYPGDFLKKIIADFHDGFYVVERDRTITWWNNGSIRITGYASNDVVGRKCGDNILWHVDADGVNLCEKGCPLQKTLEDGESRQVEVYLHHRDGHRVPVLVRVTPIRNGSGSIVGAAELFSDISSKAHYREKIDTLRKMAMFDQVTGLPNRKYVEMKIHSMLDEMREHDVMVGLLMIELDNFKNLNDRYGSKVGDKVLKVISQTLKGNVKAVDVLGRWSGVRFLAVVDNTPEDQLFSIANTLRVLIEQSVPIKSDARYRITASMGIVYAQKGESVDSFVKRAENMIAITKKSGRNRITSASSNIVG